MKIHERIRAARIAQDRKVTEVARLAQVDDAHLIRFERGDRGMSSEKVDRLLTVLGLEVRRSEEHGASKPGSGWLSNDEASLSDAPTVT